MATTTVAATSRPDLSREDRTQLLIAELMEGGREDDQTCRDLDLVTSLLNEDFELTKANKDTPSICGVIDADCLDTILGHMDMRQPENVRAHATLTAAAYLKAAGEEGHKALSAFFFDRVRRGTYDDYIVAFCVASLIFPIAPELTSELFLSPGFLATLGPLMSRKWKSRKVETACLEMLNAACTYPQCREAVEKYCIDWLEEVVDQDPNEVTRALDSDTSISLEDGSVSMRRHSLRVQIMAGVVLAKIKAIPSKPSSNEDVPRIQTASSSIEDLAGIFALFQLDVEHDESNKAKQHSIEGLAYATLRSSVKEQVSQNGALLKNLVQSLNDAPPKSPTTYGILSIFVNLTRYQPNLTEEEEKISQLKAYANAKGKESLERDPLNDDTHVSARCVRVFEAGITPVLVTHSKNGSVASLSLVISIIHSLSVTPTLRGRLAQQGAVKLLLAAWSALPETEALPRRTAAQALARILISIDPSLIFGGNRAIPVTSAVRPLLAILSPDESADTRDLLPCFESLMALTNLASLQNSEIQSIIIRTAWQQIEDLLLSSNRHVCKAAVELICNLVPYPEGMVLYADGTPQARQRLHILVALADAEDPGTRSAAGGALAGLTAHENVVKALLQRDRGIQIVLKMCADESDDLRHRAAVILLNVVTAAEPVGKQGRDKVKAEGGVGVLTEAAKKSRRAEVVEVVLEVLKVLLDGPQ
ncbi:probable cro1 protein [Cephalotrichum gorgonifer]|uniref:Probable cro1 protein n=1 Tax=Cephalotrichum gorgonifer TaxID=2041049 RepID=A0AAE8SWT0_9PEZI|nr:probable cro1 protein [Cephalotrichum gorgonifer]